MNATLTRRCLLLGALLGFLAVALGAFGAHGLKDSIPAERLAVYETGVRYHMFHALALLAVGAAASRLRSSAARAAVWLWLGGVVVFSGTLYLLAWTGTRWLGAITPLGGLCLLAGWVAVAWGAWKGP